MTETGSLGPIDAQVKIGRSVGSAHDYKEWIDAKRVEAAKNKVLNPVDALIIAQISPSELAGVYNSLEFAKDLIIEWLPKYKFKKWTVTETAKNPVTDEMRIQRAKTIAEQLCNHTYYRSHGRLLKINDLKADLLIEDIDKDAKLADIVYRIKTIVKLIFDSSTTFKIYYSEDLKLAKTFAPQQTGIQFPLGGILPMPQQPNQLPAGAIGMPLQNAILNGKIGLKCPKCGKQHDIIGYFDLDSQEIVKRGLPINPNIKENDDFICDNCNFVIDLKPIKANIEIQTNKKITFK